MKDIIAWLKELLAHLHHHDDPVNVPAPATTLPAPPAGAVDLVQQAHTVLSTGAATPPPGSPAANMSHAILAGLLAGHENDPVPTDTPTPQPSAPPEDRGTHVIDRVGSPRYWKAAAGQDDKLRVPVPSDWSGGVMKFDVSGDAPQEGTPVESFNVAVVGGEGGVIVPKAAWMHLAQVSVSVSAGMADFFIVVTPATDGAGFVQRTA